MSGFRPGQSVRVVRTPDPTSLNSLAGSFGVVDTIIEDARWPVLVKLLDSANPRAANHGEAVFFAECELEAA